MHGHDRDLVGIVAFVIVHDQADMFEEIAQRFIFLHCAGEFGQVFQPSRASVDLSACNMVV